MTNELSICIKYTSINNIIINFSIKFENKNLCRYLSLINNYNPNE
ncbi:hypothetical protein c7_L1085 [Megavirus courdo7]|uniref:Uncharacterized protein n=1 Tax=Megavirus courdo7 TaxID=1128135 RepID=H2EC09_9VIRU|nr:hypothetical protein c7_L1085 [Megavirus courdo7]